MVAPGDEVRVQLRPLQDQAGFRLGGAKRNRLVEQRLVGHDPAGFDAAAGGKNHLGLGVVQPSREFGCRKAAEHHGVDRPDAGAGQHRDRRFRHHRHIEDDTVAGADAEIPQHGGKRAHLREQLRIGDSAADPVTGES